MSDEPVSAPRAASGWFAVGGDQVIHGWARDKHRPTDRLTVAVAIDGRPVGTARCDRFVPTLLEQGESDGFSGFAYAIPPAWRDGRPHQVTVEVVVDQGEGPALKSRRAEFTLPAGGPLPTVTLHRGDASGIEGMASGFHTRQALELWVGGQRLPEIDPEWRWAEGTGRPFRLAWDEGVLALAAEGAVLAYPGAIEAGLPGTPIATLIEAEAWPADGEGRFRLVIGPRLRLPDGTVFQTVLDGTEPGPSLCLADGEAPFELPDGARSLQLADGSGRPLGGPVRFRPATLPKRLIPNADLSRWTADGPDGFVGDGLVRGFHAFPPALKSDLGLSGHLAAMPVAASEGAPVVAHDLPPVTGREPRRLGLQLFARASDPLELAWQLERGGETVARSPVVVGPRWQHFRSEVTVPPDPRPLRLALVRAGDGAAARIEVAGLSAGAPDARRFAAPAAGPSSAPTGVNLVPNAALTRWPDGLVVDGHGSRVALAEGWTVQAREALPVRATALPAPGRDGSYALSLRVPAGSPALSLEIALDAGEIAGAGRLRFTARQGAGAVRFGLIDRIVLVRRRAGGGDEALVAAVARKLALGGQWDEYRLPFLCRAGAERRFEAAGDEPFEHVLRLELHPPVALDIHGVDLSLGEEAPAPVEPAPPTFEDPAIRAQLDSIRGLDGWRSVVPLRAGTAAPPRPVAAEPRRWSWNAAPGPVEVGVPVHDAADDALRCLAALAGSTGVPHLVHVLDDGSGEDTRRRLADFVADKPWMRLSVQGNGGYTAAANRLVGGSAADWVVLLNSDAIVTRGWLEGLLAAAAGDDRTALVGPVSNAATYQSVPEPYDGTGKWAVNPLPDGWGPEEMAALVAQASEAEHPEVPLLNGFCTLIRRAAFQAVGGFDERSFPAGYGEENDLCLRLGKAGWRLRVADDVYVWHAKSASFGPVRRAELSRAGDKAFRALHADVDVAALGRGFLATPALARLRERMRAAYPPAAVPVPVEQAR
jgi:GT2 family glycosyltransferase